MPPNILQLQREVESLSDERLLQEAQMPNMFPAYLIQQEMVRREQERNAYQSRKAQQPTNTVHDRLIERALSGIGSIPQQLSPEQEMFAQQAMMDMSPEQMMQQQMMMQSPMPQPMADGGLVGYHEGGDIPFHPHDSRGRHYGVEGYRLVGERPEWVLPGSPADKMMGYQDAFNIKSRDLFNSTTDFVKDLFTPSERSYVYGVPTWGIPDMEPQEESLPQRYSYDPAISGSEAYYGKHDELGRHSLPNTTQEMLQQFLAQPEQRQEDRGIPSLVASMQAPAVQRQELDLSQYFQMTPEERAVLDRARADAQSLESRIDTESDRLSAQANILSNVARAMARGQVPTAGEPLRELQTAQRGRREGIMDESRAMEMAALAQEAGLSRAEQEALMERAMVEDERDYQEVQRQRLTEEKLRFAEMLNSEDESERLMASVMLGIAPRQATETASIEGRNRLLSAIAESVSNISSENPDNVIDIRDGIVDVYSEAAAALGYTPERLRDIVTQYILIEKPDLAQEFRVEETLQRKANGGLQGAANGGLLKNTYQIEF